ncbi:MAG: SDR family NAD(P)-dependent oxidoreductase [Limisphaerales bacterium]
MKPRVILITGANGGLGQAIARAFLTESPDNLLWLGVHARRETAEKLSGEFPGRCEVADLDVTRPEAWRALVARIVTRDQRLDVLVNNAGFHSDSLLAQMPPEAWRGVLATNLDGTFHGCQTVLPTMISQRHGRIVNIASLSALVAPAGQTNYAAAKAGVVALTQSLAKEVARIGITVNAICPGFIETESLASLDADARKTMVARIPMRRVGRPDEVASAVRFLASADAGYITGSTLKVDGGIL